MYSQVLHFSVHSFDKLHLMNYEPAGICPNPANVEICESLFAVAKSLKESHVRRCVQYYL